MKINWNCSKSKGCHFCQVFWEFTDEMLTHPSTPALLFSVHLRKKKEQNTTVFLFNKTGNLIFSV